MHIEILNSSQNDLLPVVSDFSKDFYLVGGTAIALYLGHRNSIDFDLFSFKKIKERSIKKYFKENDIEYTVLHQAYDQLHIIVQNVKITFFQFPYEVEHKNQFENIITIPSLINF